MNDMNDNDWWMTMTGEETQVWSVNAHEYHHALRLEGGESQSNKLLCHLNLLMYTNEQAHHINYEYITHHTKLINYLNSHYVGVCALFTFKIVICHQMGRHIPSREKATSFCLYNCTNSASWLHQFVTSNWVDYKLVFIDRAACTLEVHIADFIPTTSM